MNLCGCLSLLIVDWELFGYHGRWAEVKKTEFCCLCREWWACLFMQAHWKQGFKPTCCIYEDKKSPHTCFQYWVRHKTVPYLCYGENKTLPFFPIFTVISLREQKLNVRTTIAKRRTSKSSDNFHTFRSALPANKPPVKLNQTLGTSTTPYSIIERGWRWEDENSWAFWSKWSGLCWSNRKAKLRR